MVCVCVDGSGAFSLCSELDTFVSDLALDSLEIPIISASPLCTSLLTLLTAVLGGSSTAIPGP